MSSSTSATYVQLASTTSSCRSSPTVKAATFLVVDLSRDLHVVVRQRKENTKWRAKLPSLATPMPFHRVREGRFVDTDTALPSTSQTPCGICYRWPWYPWAKRLSEGLVKYRFLRGESLSSPPRGLSNTRRHRCNYSWILESSTNRIEPIKASFHDAPREERTNPRRQSVFRCQPSRRFRSGLRSRRDLCHPSRRSTD